MSDAILFDMTEFIRQPLRTGIQRVVYEIVQSSPPSTPLIPVCLRDGQFLELQTGVFQDMKLFFSASAEESAIGLHRLRNATANVVRVHSVESVKSYRGVLVSEVFVDAARANFYRNLRSCGVDYVFFLLYDCLPWVHPEWFPRGYIVETMHYIQLLMGARWRSYISNASRLAFQTRIFRQPENRSEPVVPLGADWIDLPPRSSASESTEFVVVGTVEPRKNTLRVLDAFEQLWQKENPPSLCFVGRPGWLSESDMRRVKYYSAHEPRFRWVPSATDTELAELIRSCRATIYPSLGEGYGLPPLESLHLGVPVIVSEDIPSVQMIDGYGQIRMPISDAIAIQNAVLSAMDNRVYRKLCVEIRNLELPKWRNLGLELCRWIAESTTENSSLAA